MEEQGTYIDIANYSTLGQKIILTTTDDGTTSTYTVTKIV